MKKILKITAVAVISFFVGAVTSNLLSHSNQSLKLEYNSDERFEKELDNIESEEEK